MTKTGWTIFVAGMLISTAAIADDRTSSDPGNIIAHTLSHEVAGLLTNSTITPRFQLEPSLGNTAYPLRGSHAIANISFRDGSVVGRISRIRNIALLLLAETRKTRLFLGLNGDGLVGVHFVASSSRNDERYLSLARMPYLDKNQPRNEIH